MTVQNRVESADNAYRRGSYDKSEILRQLRKKGFRVTRQREVIIDTILNHECTTCKEIYYQAVMIDSRIGMATVYRMVNTLTDIGILKVASLKPANFSDDDNACRITMKDNSVLIFNQEELLTIVRDSVRKKGYSPEDVAKVEIK